MESAPSSLCQTPLLDFKQLGTFIPIGYEDYLDLLGDIISDVPKHLELVRDAIQAGNPKDVSSRAHSFRGMISYYGCAALMARLTVLDHHPDVPADQADAIFTELQTLWNQTLAAIKEWEKSVPEFASGT